MLVSLTRIVPLQNIQICGYSVGITSLVRENIFVIKYSNQRKLASVLRFHEKTINAIQDMF